MFSSLVEDYAAIGCGSGGLSDGKRHPPLASTGGLFPLVSRQRSAHARHSGEVAEIHTLGAVVNRPKF
jgi:hypothetical protein